MSKDIIQPETLKRIINSSTSTKDESSLKLKLSQENISPDSFFLSLFNELSKIINNLSDNATKIDTVYLNLIADYFGSISLFFPSPNTLIPFDKVEQLIELTFKICDAYVSDITIGIKGKLDNATINNIISIFIKLLGSILSSYKKDFIDLFIIKGTTELNNILFQSLSRNYNLRAFIYSFFESFKDRITEHEIAKYRFNMNELIKNIKTGFTPETVSQPISELRTIAELFQFDFQIISKEYSELVLLILRSSNSIKESITGFFTNLINIVFNNPDKSNVSIADFIFDIYEQEIDSDGNTCEAILNALKTFINLDRYTFLLSKTSFPEKVIATLPKQREDSVINCFFSILFELCDAQKGKNYLPKEELSTIIKKVKDFITTDNLKGLNIIINHMKTLIKRNIEIINVILNYCNYFNYTFELVENKETQKNEISNALLSFGDYIIKANNNKYEYKLPKRIHLSEDETSLKANSISLEYENDPSIYEEKLKQIIQQMICLFNSKDKYNEFVNIGNIILRTFYTKDLSILANVEKDTITSIVQIFNFLADFIGTNNSEGVVENYLNMLLNYIINSNQALINYKANKALAKTHFKSQTVLTCEDIEKMIQSLIYCKNENIKMKALKHIQNSYFNKEKSIIDSPFIMLLIIKIYKKDVKYKEELKNVLTVLKEFFEISSLNIKSILMFDIIEVIMNIIYQYRDDTESEVIALTFSLLEKLSKFFTKEHYNIFITQLYVILKKTNMVGLVMKLINVLKETVIEDMKEINKKNVIYLTKYQMSNPYVYNMLAVNSLFNNNTSKYLSFNYTVFLNGDENTKFDNFHLLDISSSNYNMSIYISNNNLLLNEEGKESTIKEEIFSLLALNTKNTIGVEIDKEKKELQIYINNNHIQGNGIQLEKFIIDLFDIIIGFKKENLLKEDKNPSFLIIDEFIALEDKTNTEEIQSKIITKITFNKIQIEHISKLQVILPLLEKYGFTSEEGRYIPNVKYSNEGNNVNKSSRCFLISNEDNIVSFASKNEIYELQEVHKKTIQNKFFISFGIDTLYRTSYFCNQLFNFLYENEFMKSQDIFIQLMSIISLVVQKKFYSIKRLEYDFNFFSNLSYILYAKTPYTDSKDFITNFISLFEKKEELYIKIIHKVLLSEGVFDKLPIESKQLIIKEINDNVIQSEYNEDMSSLLERLINIAIYVDVSNAELVDLIIENIIKIYELAMKSSNEEVKASLEQKAKFYCDIMNDYDTNVKNHQTLSKLKKAKDVFLMNDNIKSQFSKLTERLYRFIIKLNPHLFSEEEKKTKNKECLFCEYIHKYCLILYDIIKTAKQYSKSSINYFKVLYLLNQDIQNIFHNNEYSFFLSAKESVSRQRKQFVLKQSDTEKDPKIKNNFKYIYTREYYDSIYSILNKITTLDSFLDEHILSTLCDGEIIFGAFNCLYLKKMQKTLSVAVITPLCLYVFTNMVIDSEGTLHTVEGDLSEIFWAKKDYKKEWDEYCLEEKNKKFIKKPSVYGYKNNKFSIKKIAFREISEMYRRVYLHIDNSIEFIMKNGASFYFVFNRDKRDYIYSMIIKNISVMYESKNRVHDKDLIKDTNTPMFYMRYSPFVGGSIKKQKEQRSIAKQIVNANLILQTISKQWSKHQITNFDYIMFLNTICGRTYNNLSQYFIFPWIIKDFFESLSISSNSIYRDLTYPIFAQDEDRRDTVINKYEMKESDNKYHCGTFYSTHAFVSYYLLRQCPYSEIALEIQGGHFDAPDRLFNSTMQISSMDERFQELIPELYYLPELFVNTNEYVFGHTQKRKKVSDVELPQWSQNDPRLFVLIHKKIFEHKIVSENLNKWIDLIFGYRQQGQGAVEVCNTYRQACYPIDNKKLNSIEEAELDGMLYEAAELGVNPNQLFKEPHSKKENCAWFYKNNLFFDTREKFLDITKTVIPNVKFDIISSQIGEAKCYNENKFVNHYHGGISSLYSIMMANNKKFISTRELTQDKQFVLVTKGKKLLGAKYNIYISYHENVLCLVKPKYNLVYEFALNENTAISSVVANYKGTKIIVGFENGDLIEYKIKEKTNVNVRNEESNIVITGVSDSKKKMIELTTKPKYLEKKSTMEKVVNPKISFNHINNKDYVLLNVKENSQDKEEDKSHQYLYLVTTSKQTSIPSSCIQITVLNEAYSLLIASDNKNRIYLFTHYSFSLINSVDYLSFNSCPIKEILPIKETGDFLASTALSVSLFSVNGVPLAELNLTDKIYSSMSPITTMDYACLSDVTLFTGHKNGNLNIWKVKNKNANIQFNQRISHQYNEVSSKDFLKEYKYAYKKERISKIEDFELKRKFDLLLSINMNEELSPLLYIKMSFDMSSMVVFDRNKNVYQLTWEEKQKKFDDDDDFYDKRCKCCNRGISDCCGRESMFNDEEVKDKIEKEKEEDICDECSQVLNNSEYFLYGY